MSADQPGLAAASDTATQAGDAASGSSSAPSTHYPPAPGTRRARAARFISDRLSPPDMPASPPVLDGPPVTAAPPRQVNLPPAPPTTQPLSESEQQAAAQVVRAAEARAATVAPRRPDNGPSLARTAPPVAPAVAPSAPSVTSGATVAAATAAAAPAPTPTEAPPPPAPAREPREPKRRPAKALPPGETGVVVDQQRGRRLSRREQRQLGRLQARKVKRVVRHIEPWSVFKISLIFNLCLFITFMVAGTLLWNLATSAGTIDNILDFLNDLIGGEISIEGDTIFRAALYGGAVMVIANSLFMVLLVVLFNLISDLVGGIRVTVIEEENVRRAPVQASAAPAGSKPAPRSGV